MSDFQKNQQSIIRQSQLKFVLDYTKLIGTPLTLKEIVDFTNVLVHYCTEGYSTELGARLDKIDKYIQDKFEEPA